MVGYEDKSLDDNLRVRINSGEFETFKEKSNYVTGSPYQVLLREMIKAFNEDRLRIVKTDDQKTKMGELYNV